MSRTVQPEAMHPAEPKGVRGLLGMSQDAFADALSVGREALAGMETGIAAIEQRITRHARAVAVMEQLRGNEIEGIARAEADARSLSADESERPLSSLSAAGKAPAVGRHHPRRDLPPC
jgi:DNA-binding XRE family transcriptional regulator